MSHANTSRRSDCPIAYSLELIGDAWSLLIIRDIVFAGKHTFGEFLASGEGIARNILANRLARLEAEGLIVKKPHPSDGRKDWYAATEAGLELIPVLLELSKWGAGREPETAETIRWLEELGLDREDLIHYLREKARAES